MAYGATPMTPEQRFEEAKSESMEAVRSISKYESMAEYLIEVDMAHIKEAAAFRDMVKDNGYVHTITLDDFKFSWEE
jgi:hypothetical protein